MLPVVDSIYPTGAKELQNLNLASPSSLSLSVRIIELVPYVNLGARQCPRQVEQK
ncbi:hypothetical protein JYU34_005581 [Plutella xylostella]|uniref:Uncharacterized protein n=1 Tax=Plutella xylostella TaxID=51655 RepID=A0ABQ7QTP3_PLUXY|nr:hypothetical protein JYU34_005581 [Plutella xylostella]